MAEQQRARSIPRRSAAATGRLDTGNLGFLLAKASSRWNALLADRFRQAGYADVRPAYGSILIPLFARDGLRMTELAREARLSKQTMTTMIRLMERDGLVQRHPDPADGRATLIVLTPRARSFAPVAGVIVREMTEDVANLLGEGRVDSLAGDLKALMSLGAEARLEARGGRYDQ